MANKTRVQFTANFEANLLSIEAYWDEVKFPDGFDHLLSALTEKTLPNLESFPAMGKLFFDRKACSVEATLALQALEPKLRGVAVREYRMEDYLILYAHLGNKLYLLSIKHYKQLSFDFTNFWQGS